MLRRLDIMVVNLIKSMVEVIIRGTQYLILYFLWFLLDFPSLTDHHDTIHDDHLTVINEESTEIGKKNLLYGANTRAYICSKTNLDSMEECKFEEFEEFKSKMHISFPCSDTWETKSLDQYHSSTFETMVMKEELKADLINDLDRFMGRKDFYRRVGARWIRNYLLHGPPGTGKTSLVAAIADYLNFDDVFNLTMLEVMESDFDPWKLNRGVMGSSIIVVEDIDCSLEGSTVALSNLLSFLYGLWTNGEARIVIFTTDNEESLDPTLLCRMDMQIYMGHCCFEGFKTLAFNYLGLSDEENNVPHRLYPEIKRLIDGLDVTPGQVAQELMKSKDVDVSLEGLVRFLEMKMSFISPN